MSAGESSRAHVVDIDELACSMRRKLNYYCSPGETHATGTSLCMIYKVPEHIREAERHAYEPIVLSIGPYHYGTPELQVMERKKWSCLDYVLKLNPEKDLLDYLNAIAILENQVRNCYTEEVKMEKLLFLQMLLLDGCLILVSLYGTEGFVPPSQEVPVMCANCQDITEENGIDKGINMGHTKNKQSMKENSMLEVESSEASSSKESTRDCKLKCKEHMQSKDNSVKIGQWYTSFVAHDLLLLENQIPFYIVKRIYNFVAGKEVTFPSLTDKIAKVIEDLVRNKRKIVDFHKGTVIFTIFFNLAANILNSVISWEITRKTYHLKRTWSVFKQGWYVVPPSQEVTVVSANCQDRTEKDGIDKGISMGHTKNGQSMNENLMLEVESSKDSSSQESTQDCKLKCEEHMQSVDNSVPIGQWYTSFVAHDLFLLENQIPFFIVRRIYELVAGKDAKFISLTDKIAAVIEGMMRYYPKAIKESERPKDFHHLLHLCHMYFRPRQKLEEDQYQTRAHYFPHFLQLGLKYIKFGHQRQQNKRTLPLDPRLYCLDSSQQRWHRALQYYEAGVEFKKREFNKHNPHSLLNISFTNGVMEIPCLPIDENTSCLFRNFIAFEQTCPQFGNDFTAYIVFLSQFMSMPEDVTMLAQRGIIEHQLRSNKVVSTLFAKLSKDVIFDFDGEYCLKSVYGMMEEHYQSRLNWWMAWVRQRHFSNPWLALAALAAAIMLFCTIMQTLIAVYSYVKLADDNSDQGEATC